MVWVNDAANNSTPVNDATFEGTNLTIDDMDLAIDAAEGTLDNPISPWILDAANSSSPVNDNANA